MANLDLVGFFCAPKCVNPTTEHLAITFQLAFYNFLTWEIAYLSFTLSI